MKVLSAAEMREVDRLTIERHGIPSLQLMETAGTRIAETCQQAIRTTASHAITIAVLCGKGNNGGDGLVAARHLQSSNTRVKVFLFSELNEVHNDAATNLQRWLATGNEVVSITNESAWQTVWPEISNAQIMIDAIFGTGFRGATGGVIAKAISAINGKSKTATATWPNLILAIDTPSGLPSDGEPAAGPVLYAHKTVTFTAPKLGQLVSHEAAAAGVLEVAAIGSPPSLIEEIGQGAVRWVEPQEFANLPLVRTVDSHKGLYGHALVIAGSVGKTGAAIMASYAALRTGAGLVTVATPDVVLPIVASAHPELMTEPLAATADGTIAKQNLAQQRFDHIAKKKDLLAMGPGLGQNPETQDFIRNVVLQTDLPIILDADGLNAFAANADLFRTRKSKFLAITPHPGEMARLLACSIKDIEDDRLKVAQETARRWNAHVILKGFHTIIAGPDGQVFINSSGNPGLAKGGSGDILTGVLAALTGQFKTDDWTRVLALGVYLHGKAAELATENIDESGLLATEVANAIPHARLQLLKELQARD